MKERLRLWYDRLFAPIKPLEAGVYHAHSAQDAEKPYRMHLRVNPNGEGVLILNASTVLHLNRTATEYAYHLVNATPPDQVARIMGQRYRVSEDLAKKDFQDLGDRIQSLIDTPDLDPVTYLEFERLSPYSVETTAPYRLDCALTYRLPTEEQIRSAPTERVKRELLTTEWQTIMEKAWTAGIPHIIFTGGEPTLRPDLPDLIAYAEQLGQVTGVLTTGGRISDSRYLHQLLQAGLDHMMLVLDAEDEVGWEALRDVLPEDLFVTVHLTVTERNQDVVTSMLDRLKEMGVTSISLSCESEELKDRLAQARQEVADRQMTLVWDLPVPYSAMHPVAVELENEEEVLAGAGKAWLYVEPDGDVLPTQGTNQVLGNLLTDPWENIWEKARQLA